ncbi:DUF4442 domain-containing protein [bacterium]|nr:DUF4442 domain-containing protein [bacterium]
MKVVDLAINAALGMIESGEGCHHLLELPESSLGENHAGTVHASAQFALAEACSGQWLFGQLRDLQAKVIPLLRTSNVKYRKPALGRLLAFAELVEGGDENLTEALTNKGRLIVSVKIVITDENQQTTMTGKFDWFLQLKSDEN